MVFTAALRWFHCRRSAAAEGARVRVRWPPPRGATNGARPNRRWQHRNPRDAVPRDRNEPASVAWKARLPAAHATGPAGRMQAGHRRRPRGDTRKPRAEPRQAAVERLADRIGKVEPHVQPDVGDAEPAAGEELAPVEHLVEPADAVLRDPFEADRRLRRERDAPLEARQPFRIVVCVVDVLGDVELGAALPLAREGALRRRGADQRRRRMQLLQVLHDRDRLADRAAVVEQQRRRLPGRVVGQIRRLAVLAREHVDLARRQVQPLLQQEHAHRARRRTECIEQQHGINGTARARRWQRPGA